MDRLDPDIGMRVNREYSPGPQIDTSMKTRWLA
jgi:hypothetical protein